MATRREPRFKECRRLGVNVCGHPKAMSRANAPAFTKRKKQSEYSLQLTEKQKIKGYYNIMEKQLRRYFEKAQRKQMRTGDALFQMLECRLDNLVYRLGFANSIRLARQQVNHGLVLVNGQKVDIPSYQVKPKDVITLREKYRANELFKDNFLVKGGFPLPYLSVNKEEFSGVLERMPEREEIPVEVNDSLVVEFYSR